MQLLVARQVALPLECPWAQPTLSCAPPAKEPSECRCRIPARQPSPPARRRANWQPLGGVASSNQPLQGLFEWAINSTQKLLPTLSLAARCPRPWKSSGRPVWAFHPQILYARGGPSPAIGGPSEPMSCQLITLGHMPRFLAVLTLNFISCHATATFRCIAQRASCLHLALAISLAG